MNLLDIDSKFHDLLVSNQFWLYFVISIPLTIATMVCWRWRMQTYRKGYLMENTENEKGTKTMDITSDIEMV